MRLITTIALALLGLTAWAQTSLPDLPTGAQRYSQTLWIVPSDSTLWTGATGNYAQVATREQLRQLAAQGYTKSQVDSAITSQIGLIDFPVTSVAGKTGDVELDASDVGLGNVDNTSDADKPISTATQGALDGKENAFSKGSLVAGTGVTLSGTLANRLVGSGNVTINSTGTTQNLSLGSAAGQVSISGGNTVTLTSLGQFSVPSSWMPPIGLYPLRIDASSGYPVVTNGGGIRFQRNNSNTGSSFELVKTSSTSDDALYLRTGDGTNDGWHPFQIVATRDWVSDNYSGSVFTRLVNGLVPSPGGSGTTRYLREDGTWAVPSGGGGGTDTDLSIQNRTSTTLQIGSSTGTAATVPQATTTLAGLLNASDKAKLNGLEPLMAGNGISIDGGQINNTWDFTTYGLGGSSVILGAASFEPISRPTTFIRASVDNSIYETVGAGIHIRYNNDRAAQLWFNFNGNVQYRHTPSNGNWSGIETFWTSTNFTPSDYLLTSNFTWSNLSGKPSTFAPSPHSHSAADINSGTLAAARIPTLSISKISGLQSALDAKATSGTGSTQVRTNTQLDARYVQSIGAGSGISVSGTTVSLANMSANTIKGRSGSTGEPQNLTPIQVRDIINPVTTNSSTTINMQNPLQRGSARSSNTTFSLSNSSAGRQVQFHMANSGSNAIQITITGATPHGNRIIPANQSAVISIIDFGNSVISYIVVPSI